MLRQAVRRLSQCQLLKQEYIVYSRWFSSQAKDKKQEEEEDDFGEDLVKEALERAKQKGTEETSQNSQQLDQKQQEQGQGQAQQDEGGNFENTTPREGEEQMYTRSWKNLITIPPLPQSLAYAGMIPFIVLCPPLVRNVIDPFVQLSILQHAGELQMVYAAGVLSFLGAVHWGVALVEGKDFATATSKQNTQRYLYGVLPMLLSWPIATLLEPPNAGIILTILFLITNDIDLGMVKKGMLPPWYAGIRTIPTVLATSAITLTFADSYAKWFQDIKHEVIEEELKSLEEGHKWTNKQVQNRYWEKMTNKDARKPLDQKDQSQ